MWLCLLTVCDGLHTEAKESMQEVHYVVERVLVDVLFHSLPELHFIQLVQTGQAVLGLHTVKAAQFNSTQSNHKHSA